MFDGGCIYFIKAFISTVYNDTEWILTFFFKVILMISNTYSIIGIKLIQDKQIFQC